MIRKRAGVAGHHVRNHLGLAARHIYRHAIVLLNQSDLVRTYRSFVQQVHHGDIDGVDAIAPRVEVGYRRIVRYLRPLVGDRINEFQGGLDEHESVRFAGGPAAQLNAAFASAVRVNGLERPAINL